MTRRLFALCLLGGLLLAACGDPPPAPPYCPQPTTFNSHVLDVLGTYPTDGTHRYWWPKTGSWAGNVRDISYDGRIVLRGDPQGRCFCCGLTLEVFLQAWERSCRELGRPYRIADLDAEGLVAFKDAWFGSDGDRRTLFGALTNHKLGKRIEDWEQAQPGDFVQLWRHSGSGHSVIFLGWVRNEDAITGLRYWSCQKSTGGIGERTEDFGTEGSSVKRDEFYLCRVAFPSR